MSSFPRCAAGPSMCCWGRLLPTSRRSRLSWHIGLGRLRVERPLRSDQAGRPGRRQEGRRSLPAARPHHHEYQYRRALQLKRGQGRFYGPHPRACQLRGHTQGADVLEVHGDIMGSGALRHAKNGLRSRPAQLRVRRVGPGDDAGGLRRRARVRRGQRAAGPRVSVPWAATAANSSWSSPAAPSRSRRMPMRSPGARPNAASPSGRTRSSPLSATSTHCWKHGTTSTRSWATARTCTRI